MIKNIVDTKSFIEIRLKDYPVGRKLRCILWLEGMYEKDQVEEYIKSNMVLINQFKDAVIHEVKVFNSILTNCRKEEEKYGELILISVITNYTASNKKKESEKKVDINSLKLHNYSVKEITKLKEKIDDELIMREYHLSDREYEFYKNNNDEVTLNSVKEIYEKCDGDIFKLRKERIRENISNLLKKVE